MKTYRVTIEITPPVEATEREVEEWVKFQIGYTAQLDGSNPLVDYDIEASRVQID